MTRLEKGKNLQKEIIKWVLNHNINVNVYYFAYKCQFCHIIFTMILFED